MLLKQTTFLSFFVLTLSSLTQVYGWWYVLPNHFDVEEPSCTRYINDIPVTTMITHECRNRGCTKMLKQFIGDETLYSRPVSRSLISPTCFQSCFVYDPCTITDPDTGEVFKSAVCLLKSEGVTFMRIELWRKDKMLSCTLRPPP